MTKWTVLIGANIYEGSDSLSVTNTLAQADAVRGQPDDTIQRLNTFVFQTAACTLSFNARNRQQSISDERVTV